MRRRDAVALIGGAAAWPLPALAQPTLRPVIGYLGSESPALFASRLAAFRRGLASMGFEESRNVAIEYRWASGRNDRLPALAAELIRHPVDVLAAPGSLASALAAKAATSTVPVIFETGADPVAAGLVPSLSRPGGNVTGITSLNSEIGPKRLDLLRELLPSATVFAVLVNPSNPKNAEASAEDLQRAARARNVEIHVVKASTEPDFEAVFAALRRLRVQGLVIANETFFVHRSEQLAALSLREKLPTVAQAPEFVRAGGLVSYSGSISESHGQAGVYAARVLKGERPANLPVYQATKFELAINIKTARLFGLEVSSSLAVRADEVIE